MTGTPEKGSYSEGLLRHGQMTMQRYPVHLNHAQFQQLEKQNDFSQTIPYRSRDLSAKREIQFWQEKAGNHYAL